MVPVLTQEQRHEYLDRALQARRERAEIRAKLKTGEMSIDDVFDLADEGNEAVRRMRVAALISAMPHYAKTSTEKLMKRLRIADNRCIRGLSNRQRNELLAALKGKKHD